jgi:ferredoxin
MRHEVTIDDTGERFECIEQESVLAGLARLGRRGIPIGCRGGGCGVCKVEIRSGDFEAKRMSRDHVSPEDEAAGRLLACRVFPRSPLVLSVIGRMQKAVVAGHPSKRGEAGDGR